MPKRSSNLPSPAAARWRRATATRSKASSSSAIMTSSSPMAAPAAAFRPLWWRTYRYLELDIETRDQPLTVDDLAATYVGYPFERRARFDAGSPELDAHPRRRLAHGAPLRPRNLHGLPLLRAAAVCRRHARAVPRIAIQQRRCAPHAQRHRPDQRLAPQRRLHHEPLPHAPGAVHPRLLPLVDRHGARLLVVRRRSGVRAPHAARGARRAELLRAATRRKTARSAPCPGGAISIGCRPGRAATRRRIPMARRPCSICCC